jgi:hypothetical protein
MERRGSPDAQQRLHPRQIRAADDLSGCRHPGNGTFVVLEFALAIAMTERAYWSRRWPAVRCRRARTWRAVAGRHVLKNAMLGSDA